MNDLMTLGVDATLTASHICCEVGPHEHTWLIEAQFSVTPHTDARCYRAALDNLLSTWQGKQLPPELDWSEDIARAVYTLVNCVRVHVWRVEERIHVWWPR